MKFCFERVLNHFDFDEWIARPSGLKGCHMTHVVAEPCFNCKYTDCVVVCPVECFYEGEAILFIHPEECIDCEACVPECPVAAIFHEDNLPCGMVRLYGLKCRNGTAVPCHHGAENLNG